MINAFETASTRCQRILSSDVDLLIEMQTNPAIMATLGGKLWTAEETRALLDRLTAHWERWGYGVWAVRRISDGAFIGRAGLRHVEIEGQDEVELQYALRPDQWGQGLATELALAITSFAFNRLHLRSLVAFTLGDNTASRRVMEKAGFVYERDFIHAGLPHVLYRLRNPSA